LMIASIFFIAAKLRSPGPVAPLRNAG